MGIIRKSIRKVRNLLRNGCRAVFLRRPTVSFCITCRNRFWQISRTLPQNLKDNAPDSEMVEFILVDFASSDGLHDWVMDNFRDELRSGYLKYYYSEGMPQWHMAVAKNTAHRLAENEVLVNLDCDNFTGPLGGRYVGRLMRNNGVHSNVVQLYGGDPADGTFGRVVVSRKNFFKVGGYDEDLAPVTYEDIDLVKRLRRIGLHDTIMKKKKYAYAIANEPGLGVFGAGVDKDAWLKADEANMRRVRQNAVERRFMVNEKKDSIGVHAVRMFHE